MKNLLETPRLYLRPFIASDAFHFHKLNNDPDVLKYTGDKPFKDLKEAQTFINSYDAYLKTGIGRYAVVSKENNTFLGWCGLKYHKSEDVVDIGYRFYKKHWGKGYATESAKATIDYALNTLKLPQLVAHAHIDNKASHNVLKKLDVIPVKQFTYDEQPTLQYHLNNWDYEVRQITAKETWPVRHPVLRKGRPLEDVYMQADEQESTFHIGTFYKKELVGVVSFMQDTKTTFKAPQYRLRGMAVLPDYRRKGIAGMMLRNGENHLRKREVKTLWFNAREVAISFYKNQGYQIIGSRFDIPKVGPHFVMKKEL